MDGKSLLLSVNFQYFSMDKLTLLLLFAVIEAGNYLSSHRESKLRNDRGIIYFWKNYILVNTANIYSPAIVIFLRKSIKVIGKTYNLMIGQFFYKQD